MGEFHAWAITGQVAGLQVSSSANDRPDTNKRPKESGSARVAEALLVEQKFQLQGRDGREIDVHLIHSGVALQNGHMTTLVWAARKGASYGRCILVQNHTTGAEARLAANVRRLRSRVKTGKIAVLGLLATLPAAFAIAAWLLMPGRLSDIDRSIFLIGTSIALAVLFSVGTIVAKLVLDYLRSEDDEKIWAAVNKALAAVVQPQPQPRRQLRASSGS